MTDITQLNTENAATIEVVTLSDIRRALNMYSNQEVFREWIQKADMPKPYIRINGQDHWLKSQVDDFKTLWQAHLKEISDKRVEELQKETIGKIELLAALAEYAKRVERSNSRCYKNARGSESLNEGRKRVLQLEGAIEFAYRALGGFAQIPSVLRAETSKSLQSAKNHVGI